LPAAGGGIAAMNNGGNSGAMPRSLALLVGWPQEVK
jgi:hypothetical protein